MKSVKGIIFDADNTLYRTREAAKLGDMAAFKILEKKIGTKAEELYDIWKAIVSGVKDSKNPKERTRKYSYSILLKNLGANKKILNSMLNDFEKTLLLNIEPNRNVKETLNNLGKNFELFIISDDDGATAGKKLKKLRLVEFFDFVISSTEAKEMKPSRKYYEILLKKTKKDVKNFIVVGDSFEKDLEIPKSLGMTTVLFGSENIGADFCIRDLSELRNIVGEK